MRNYRKVCFHEFYWFSETKVYWCKVISQKCPWKPIYRMYGYYNTQGFLMCRQFWKPKIKLQCNSRCKTCLLRYDHQYLIREKSPNTVTWSETNGSNMCMKFSMHKQIIPSKNPLLDGILHKILWYVCFATQIQFCCESQLQWICGNKNSLVRI